MRWDGNAAVMSLARLLVLRQLPRQDGGRLRDREIWQLHETGRQITIATSVRMTFAQDERCLCPQPMQIRDSIPNSGGV